MFQLEEGQDLWMIHSAVWSYLNLNVLTGSLSSDIHWFGAGVGQPIQRPGDLHQEPHGAVPWSQLLRGLATHVSTPPLHNSPYTAQLYVNFTFSEFNFHLPSNFWQKVLNNWQRSQGEKLVSASNPSSQHTIIKNDQSYSSLCGISCRMYSFLCLSMTAALYTWVKAWRNDSLQFFGITRETYFFWSAQTLNASFMVDSMLTVAFAPTT